MTELVEVPSMRIRRANFPDRIRFHAPGLQPYSTSEYTSHDAKEFVSISVTGNAVGRAARAAWKNAPIS